MCKMTLTQVFIDNLVCPAGKTKADYFDTKTTGLVVQVSSTGRKTFYLRYQNDRKKTIQRKLFCASTVKLADAREFAKTQLNQIALGIDPFNAKKCLKDVPTVAEFIHDSYLPYVKTYKRSWITDESLIRNHILPNFGKLYLDEVTKKDVIQFITRHLKSHQPSSVNRVLILLRYLFNLSIFWETPGMTKNPTKGIAMLEENNQRERYLSAQEANALIQALQSSDNKMLPYIISMLILTGARKSEVLNAKWEDFNFEQRLWRIPVTKSGKARHVPISDGVIHLLQSVPHTCDYTFANPNTLKPFVTIYCSWHTARKSVGLEDVRIHDLRHSFASFLVNNGRSLYEVQRILGHTQIKTTQRYAHLSHDSLLSAANEISNAIPILLPTAPLNTDPLLLKAA